MLDYEKIDDVEIENINHDDYPDFSDAYVMRAMYDDPKTGEYRELTEDELAEMIISLNATDGQALTWDQDTIKWKPKTIVANSSITANVALDTIAIQGRAVSSATPNSNEVFKWNGSSWIVGPLETDTANTANVALTANAVKADAVTSAAIANNAVTGEKIAANTITTRNLTSMGASSGELRIERP